MSETDWSYKEAVALLDEYGDMPWGEEAEYAMVAARLRSAYHRGRVAGLREALTIAHCNMGFRFGAQTAFEVIKSVVDKLEAE